MDCTIVNFDEVTFRLVAFLRKVWAKSGSKPKGLFWWSNKKANMFGALIDGKKLYYEWYEKLNAHSFLEFMKRFVATLDKTKKYVFVFDNGPAHKAKMSKEYLYSLGENIFIEFLPPYSPQLNCIETCWKIIRYNVTNSNFFQTIEILKAGIEQFLKGYFFMLIPSNYLSR
ncbi:MAG: IS630 family transposase [Nanoarchaeota archaeon]|nr:IS630 family transposase [Nanoarchaeota archaeon]